MLNNTNIKVPAKYADRIKSLDQTGNANYRVVFTDGNFEFATSQANILKVIREYLKPVEVEVVTEEPAVSEKFGLRVAKFNDQSEEVKKQLLDDHAKSEAAKKKLIKELAKLIRRNDVLHFLIYKHEGSHLIGDSKESLKAFNTRKIVKQLYIRDMDYKELENFKTEIEKQIAYRERCLNQMKEGK